MNIIIVNAFETYELRSDLLAQTMKEAGHSVCIYQSDFLHREKVTRTDQKDGVRFFHADPYARNMSWQRAHSHAKLSRRIFDAVAASAQGIDMLWVLAPPNSFVKDAAAVKKQFPHIKLVYDLIDLWPESIPVPHLKNIWPFTQWGKMRNSGLSCADYVVTECSLYQKVLKKYLSAEKAATLYWARPDAKITPHLKQDKDCLSLCYLGSINNLIDIPVIGAIIRDLSEMWPVRLHVIGDGEKRDELLQEAARAGAEVQFHGKIYDANKKQEIFDQCHFGLNIMKPMVCVGLTMKSMNYFEVGLPVINNIRGDTWDFVAEEKIGLNYSGNQKLIVPELPGPESHENVLRFYKDTLSLSIFKKNVNTILSRMMQ